MKSPRARVCFVHCCFSPGGSDGKASPAMQETQIQSLGREDALEKEMATHSSMLAGRIPWSLVGYNPWDHKESNMTEQLTHISSTGAQ